MTDETGTAWVGVDVGEARVGVAVAEDGSFAVPHRTFPAKHAVDELIALLRQLDTGNLVFGWPLELSGREGLATRRVEKFVKKLRTAADEQEMELDVRYRDERLTTGLASALLDEAGVRGRKRRQVVDQVAATQILQDFLDEMAND